MASESLYGCQRKPQTRGWLPGVKSRTRTHSTTQRSPVSFRKGRARSGVQLQAQRARIYGRKALALRHFRLIVTKDKVRRRRTTKKRTKINSRETLRKRRLTAVPCLLSSFPSSASGFVFSSAESCFTFTRLLPLLLRRQNLSTGPGTGPGLGPGLSVKRTVKAERDVKPSFG